MLAFLGGRSDLQRTGYEYEPKLDGTRALCYVDSSLRFLNRREHDVTERYPDLSFRKSIRAVSCVLDGEIVVYDAKGNPSFSLLQKREQSRSASIPYLSRRHPATYVAFDILELGGKDVTSSPLTERKVLLKDVVEESERLQVIASTADGRKLWEVVEARGLEGVMAKRTDSVYEPGRRSLSWIKIKALHTLDCVIVGFTSEKRSISALALGIYLGTELSYVGRVGTGFTSRFLDELREVLDRMVIERPPVGDPPDHTITWVRPELVAEVEYLQLTNDGHLRAPSFRRMRTDKRPTDCTFDELGKI